MDKNNVIHWLYPFGYILHGFAIQEHPQQVTQVPYNFPSPSDMHHFENAYKVDTGWCPPVISWFIKHH